MKLFIHRAVRSRRLQCILIQWLSTCFVISVFSGHWSHLLSNFVAVGCFFSWFKHSHEYAANVVRTLAICRLRRFSVAVLVRTSTVVSVTIFLHCILMRYFALCRLFLRQFAIEVLRSAFNNSIQQVRRVLGHGSGTGHDDSYLLWFIRFFTEFNRLSSFQLALVR